MKTETLEKALTALDNLNEGIREKAIRSLARSNDPRALPDLERVAAKDPSLKLRFLAKEAMQQLRLNLTQETSLDSLIQPDDEEAEGPRPLDLNKLAAYLGDPDPAVRNKSIKASVTYRNPSALDVLLPHLKKERHKRPLRNLLIAIGILGGSDHISVLSTYLNDDDPTTRLHAIIALSYIQDKMVYPMLVSAMNDKVKQIRDYAFKFLLRLGKKRFIALLKRMLVSSRAWMREEAARACGKVNSTEIVNILSEAYAASNSPELQQRIIKSLNQLGRKGNQKAQKLLESFLAQRRSSREQVQATESDPSADLALDECAPTESPAPVEEEIVVDPEDAVSVYTVEEGGSLLGEKDPEKRLELLQEIANEQDEGRLDELVLALSREQDARVLASLIIAVGRLGGPESVSVLSPYLKHAENRIRASAVEALSFIDDDTVPELLKPMLDDQDNRTRANAIVALKDLPNVDLESPLKKMIRSGRNNAKLSAIYAILELGKSSYLAFLEKLLKDRDKNIRRKAKQALSILKEYVVSTAQGGVASPEAVSEADKVIEGEDEDKQEKEKKSKTPQKGKESGGRLSPADKRSVIVARPPPKPIHRARPPEPSLLEKVKALFGGGDKASKPAKPTNEDRKDSDVDPKNVVVITSATVVAFLIIYVVMKATGVLN